MDRIETIRAVYRKIFGPRDRRILEALRGGQSQAEVARRFNLSRQRVHQILKTSARRQRNGINPDRLALAATTQEKVRILRDEAHLDWNEIGAELGLSRSSVMNTYHRRESANGGQK